MKTEGINVMLNSKDVSEYLKISADGLEVSIIVEKIYIGLVAVSGNMYVIF